MSGGERLTPKEIRGLVRYMSMQCAGCGVLLQETYRDRDYPSPVFSEWVTQPRRLCTRVDPGSALSCPACSVGLSLVGNLPPSPPSHFKEVENCEERYQRYWSEADMTDPVSQEAAAYVREVLAQ